MILKHEDFIRQVNKAIRTWDVTEEEAKEAINSWGQHDEEAANRLDALMTVALNLKNYLERKYGS